MRSLTISNLLSDPICIARAYHARGGGERTLMTGGYPADKGSYSDNS
jgi:hypothetical protein